MSTEAEPNSRTAKNGELLRAAAALLFPSLCLSCGVHPVEEIRTGGVCDTCWKALPEPEPGCLRCGDPLPALDAEVCGRCTIDPPAFRRLRAAAPYRGVAREVLIAFKFRGAAFLAPHLARRMRPRHGEERFDEVVPVPATGLSRLRRDHPAELLAHSVATLIGAPLRARRLTKVRATSRQSGLSAQQRAPNVRGAFAARGPVPPRILLVDDVATSGATARECARALIAAGARDVDVWCFARATREDAIAPLSWRGTAGEKA
ncbi:MAG: ComF family protein [Acidobacteria bacterium]|nr:ComF family protein [Acidobacteriota bacterium]MCA1611347.1 ComF family protein [Acidobacteriota bacterium]